MHLMLLEMCPRFSLHIENSAYDYNAATPARRFVYDRTQAALDRSLFITGIPDGISTETKKPMTDIVTVTVSPTSSLH